MPAWRRATAAAIPPMPPPMIAMCGAGMVASLSREAAYEIVGTLDSCWTCIRVRGCPKAFRVRPRGKADAQIVDFTHLHFSGLKLAYRKLRLASPIIDGGNKLPTEN